MVTMRHYSSLAQVTSAWSALSPSASFQGDHANEKELQQRQKNAANFRGEDTLHLAGEGWDGGMKRLRRIRRRPGDASRSAARRAQPAVKIVGLLGDAPPTVVALDSVAASLAHPLAQRGVGGEAVDRVG